MVPKLEDMLEREMSEERGVKDIEYAMHLLQRALGEEASLQQFSVITVLLQTMYDFHISRIASISSFRSVMSLEEYAKEMNVELKINAPAALEEGYNLLLSVGENNDADRVKKYAQQKGIELKIDAGFIERRYNLLLGVGNEEEAERVRRYAEKIGLEVRIYPETFQKEYEAFLAGDEVWKAEKVEERARSEGAPVIIDQKTLQTAYDLHLGEGRISATRRIVEYAQKKGIVLKVEEGSTTLKNIDDAVVEFYHSSRRAKGRFILGLNLQGKVGLVFDPELDLHSDIAEKYGYDPKKVFGGGKLDVSEEEIVISSYSDSFDKEPRIITAYLLAKAFPEKRIIVEK